MIKMTKKERAEVEELVCKIWQTVKDDDRTLVIQALAFMLFGVVSAELKLSEREAVEYCARHMRIYAQTFLS